MATDELFLSSFYGQACVNGDGGNSSFSESGFSPQEEGVAEFKLWSPTAHSNPYELTNCALNSIKSRKTTEKHEIEEEVDLQCLVSSILDEGDEIQSGFYNRGNPSPANGLWSPKTLKEDFLQYPGVEANDKLPYSRPSDAFIRSQMVSRNERFLQKLSGISAHPHWPSSVRNGDRDSYGSHPNGLPPVLPIPKTANHLPPQTLESNHEPSADLYAANHRSFNNFPQISDAFQFQNKMSKPLCDHYESATSAKPIHDNQQDMPEHMNQLVSGLHSLLADESNQGRYGCFPNIERETEYPEDSILEQRKFPSQSMPMLREKQLEGEFWGRDIKPAFKRKDVQEPSWLGNGIAEYSPQLKPVSLSLNPPNQCPNIINRNQYSNLRSKQGQYKMKSLMQKETKMSGFFEERPQTVARVAETHGRPHVDHLGGMERFNGENIMGKNARPYRPPAHVDSGPTRFTQLPLKSQKDTTPHGSGPGMTPAAGTTGNSAAALYSQLKGAETHNGGSTCKYGDSPLAALLQKNPEGVIIQFYLHLDECSEQLGYLEGERKKVEVILAKTFPGEWTPLSPLTHPPGLALHPTRIDSLIFNQRREQANVNWVLYNMEYLCNVPLHDTIHMALNNHHQALSCVQARCGKKLANTSKRQWLGPPLTEDYDRVLLVIALKELAVTTRKLRTSLWCALQMSVPTPVKRPEEGPDANREIRIALWRSLLKTAPLPSQ
ncbi:uncharacterized protein moto [Hippocampus comes]|uniref:Meiosis specific with coiled-coil domain n=1 Tax=Hippocampus comes TaxID=109280 RepID=A0A3Q2Z594_HIPCM|nr:PREDICTED: meiosis-specific coiled-coil domain-containing protein MEIOC [Hippocampus comes]XP_019722094.1 PREDICTED: meiosis-specific coiled-coil domain-containing protein MEIOC [Hippocampus comes]